MSDIPKYKNNNIFTCRVTSANKIINNSILVRNNNVV